MSDLQTQTADAPPGKPPGLVGSDELPPERPRRGRWLLLAALVVVVLGAGAFAAMAFFGAGEDRAIDLVPRRSFAYANVFLDPSTSQKRAIGRLLERFPAETPERAQDLLGNLFDEGLVELGLEFERDVEPWLGDQIAAFVLPPGSAEATADGGILIATEDEELTREAIEKSRRKRSVDVEAATYKDRAYEREGDSVTGFVGSFLFIGSQGGFEAAVDTEESGRSLADSERYARATADLEKDRLAIAFIDTTDLVSALTEEAGAEVDPLRQLGLTEGQSQAAVLYARDEGLVIDQIGALPDGRLGETLSGIYGDPGIIERLPEDTWVAFSLPNAGEITKRIFGQIADVLPGGLGPAAVNEQLKKDTGIDLVRDVFSWLGDAAFFVSGTNQIDVGGGVLMSSTDPDASRKAVHRAAGLLFANGVPIEERTFEWQGNVDAGRPDEDAKGYAVDIGADDQVYLVAGGDRVVVAYGAEAAGGALASSSSLGDELGWDTAVDSLGEDHVPFFFVHLPSARLLVESFGLDQEEAYVEDVKPWLEPLSHVISGTRRTDGTVWVRTVIGVL